MGTADNKGRAHLAAPPPMAGVHLRIDPDLLIGSSVLFLWSMNEKLSKLWVTI